MKEKAVRKSKIGGQALIEGIMMRGLDKVSMAVRLPGGEIDLESWPVGDLANPAWYRKLPIVRGCVNLVESLILGFKCLMKSAEKAGVVEEEEEDKEPSALERWLGENLFQIAGILGIVLGVILCVVIFAFIPSILVKALGLLAPIEGLQTILEGVIKIAIFVGYLWLISRMKDIKTTFEYHGAEHKTIACYEAGDELIPANVKKYSRLHPRCGTSFLLIVLIVSIFVFSIVTWENLMLRVILKVLLLPLVVGISYEIIRLAGRYDNPFTHALSTPGLWLQHLTTREPDEKQIEVAIQALSDVIPDDLEKDQW